MPEFTLTEGFPSGKFTLSDGSGTFTLNPVVTEYFELGTLYQSVTYENVLSIKNSYVCGENIGGHKVVYLKAGKIYLADKTNNECIGSIIGMSNQSGITDGSIEVILQGEITLTPWGLTQDSNYFLGTNGAITATPPTSGILYKIGYSKDTNTIVINHNLLISRN